MGINRLYMMNWLNIELVKLAEIFDKKLKQAKLPATNYLDTVEQCIVKKEKKTMKLQKFDLNFLIVKSYFSDDGSQNFLMF